MGLKRCCSGNNLDYHHVPTVRARRTVRADDSIHWAREFMITKGIFATWFNPIVTISVASAIASKTPMKSINSIFVPSSISVRCKCISDFFYCIFLMILDCLRVFERGWVISLVCLNWDFFCLGWFCLFPSELDNFHPTNDNDEINFSIVPPLFVLILYLLKCQAVSLLLNALEWVQSKTNCVTIF